MMDGDREHSKGKRRLMSHDEILEVQRSVLAFVFGSFLIFGAPAVASAQIPFEPLRHGKNSFPVRNAKAELVQSPEQLANLWQEMGRRDIPPIVDFKKHAVVAYFAGWKPDTGYDAVIEGVKIRGGEMVVEILETTTGNCIAGQTAVAPYDVVLTIPWNQSVAPTVRTIARVCN
jgi:uncharacterized protein YqhQ